MYVLYRFCECVTQIKRLYFRSEKKVKLSSWTFYVLREGITFWITKKNYLQFVDLIFFALSLHCMDKKRINLKWVKRGFVHDVSTRIRVCNSMYLGYILHFYYIVSESYILKLIFIFTKQNSPSIIPSSFQSECPNKEN